MKAKRYLFQLTFIFMYIFFSTSSFSQNDTIWGDGTFWTKTEENTPITEAEIYCTPVAMENIVPDTTWTFITAGGGFVDFELPVLIDTFGTNVVNNHQSVTLDGLAFPNPGGDFTYAFHGEAVSNINVHDANGRLIRSIVPEYNLSKNISGGHIDISNEAKGIYTVTAQTKEATVATKVIKATNITHGNQFDKVSDVPQPVYKNTKTFTAQYAIEVVKPGYYIYKDTIPITDGNNGLITFIMTELEGIPQYQYVGGTFFDEDQTPIEGAIAKIYDQETNELLSETLSQADGTYLFPDSVLTGINYYFKTGGIEGKFSFIGDEASTPPVIENESDTLKTVYNYTLYDKLRPVPGETGVTTDPTAYEVAELHDDSQIEYSLNDTILYYLSDQFTDEQKDNIRDDLDNGMEMFGLEGVFVEVDYELNNVNFENYDPYNNPMTGDVGVNFGPGTDNTDPHTIYVNTPAGNTFYTTPGAETTLSGDEEAFFKEVAVRIFKCNEVVSRPSVGNPIPQMPDNLDRGIHKTITDHYINVFDYETAYFSLDNIADEIDAKDNPNKKQKERIYRMPLKEIPLPSVENSSDASF